MNVTRDVITDLLPVYFSGEASEDTKQLVEGYFHGDPDFERIARRAATPLATLRAAAPLQPDAERERLDLQCARGEVFRSRLAFGGALLFTLAPLTAIYSNGHLVWAAMFKDSWELAYFWSFGAFCWFHYFARLSRRTAGLVSGVFFTLLPFVSAFHLFLPGWQVGLAGRLSVASVIWLGAVIIWAQYFRLRSGALRRRTRAEIFWTGLLFWVLLVALLTALVFWWRR